MRHSDHSLILQKSSGSPAAKPVARRVGFAVLLLAAIGWLAASTGLGAEPKGDAKIIFLRLRLKDDAITLVKAATQPGTLKAPRGRGEKGEIQFELVSDSGAPLWSGVMEDPATERLEYEDPDRPGEIKIKEIKRGEVEFTVRLPWKKEARHVAFYRLAAPMRTETKQNRPPAAADEVRPVTGKKLLGKVALAVVEAAP